MDCALAIELCVQSISYSLVQRVCLILLKLVEFDYYKEQILYSVFAKVLQKRQMLTRIFKTLLWLQAAYL